MIPLLAAASDSTLLESTLAWARTRGRVLLSIAVRGALQLLLSFIFSVFLYAALYRVSAARPVLPHPARSIVPAFAGLQVQDGLRWEWGARN